LCVNSEIGQLYFKLGKRSHAEAAFRRALVISDTPATRGLLAQALEAQSLMEEAAVERQLAQRV
jgi:uncharacterized protein HemY